LNYSCTTPDPGGTGNITNDPQFVDAVNSNFHLLATSPCIDAGNNASAPGATDLDGNPRIMNGTVDMGAYESPPVLTVSAVGGTSTGGGSYLPGSNVVISATASNGHWFFTQWNDGDTNASRSIAMPLTNITYTAAFTQYLGALIFYVATNGSDAADGMSWATAKQTIQAAVDLTVDGDTVLVSNGVYATGTRVTPGYLLSNRVVITSAITVQSVNGPAVTTIMGGWDPATTNGPAAVRCAYMSLGSLVGFTLTNGATRTSGDLSHDRSGGGVYGGTLSNCVLRGNRAFEGGGASSAILNECVIADNRSIDGGGGTYQGTLNNCTLAGNSAVNVGGGAYNGTLNNCTLLGNTVASSGGGAYLATLNNCTLSGNSAQFGGGAYSATLNNCIVWSNSATSGANHDGSTLNYSCTTPDPGGTGNITNDPQFVDAVNSNFHLLVTSPCIDAGNNAVVVGATDLDGNPRIVNGTVDMGAFEAGLRALVSVATNPVAGGTVTGNGLYFAGSNATVQAAAAPTWKFVDWNDGDTNATRIITVPLTNITFTANFTPDVVTVSVQTNPVAGGTVTGDGIYVIGSNATLQAAAAPTWKFVDWNDGDTNATRIITVPATDITYTANFILNVVTVSVQTNPVAGGTVTGDGIYVIGSNATLQAAAAPTWTFVDWNDGDTNATRIITVPATDITYTANFALDVVTVSVQTNPVAGGTITGAGVYQIGSSIFLTATPRPGWRFMGWSDGDTNAMRNVTVPASDISFTAEFLPWPTLDFDGDGKSDLAVFHPETGTWYVRNSGDVSLTTRVWGTTADLPASEDFDGDDRWDYMTFKQAGGLWRFLAADGSTQSVAQFGYEATVSVPGDYDGDGIADLALYDQGLGNWHILRTGGDGYLQQNWGWSAAIPVPGDYDGDGVTDIAVFHPGSGTWYILASTTASLVEQQWGWGDVTPVPGDYDGDSKTDIAVYDPGTATWYILQSGTLSLREQQWGWWDVQPVPADYDGDGKTDITVYHQDMGDWYILQSGDNSLRKQNWGWSDAEPLTP